MGKGSTRAFTRRLEVPNACMLSERGTGHSRACEEQSPTLLSRPKPHSGARVRQIGSHRLDQSERGTERPTYIDTYRLGKGENRPRGQFWSEILEGRSKTLRSKCLSN